MWNKPRKARDINSSEEAYASALRLLEFRFRGEAELWERLEEKGFNKSVVDDTLARLKKDRYVDDDRLLESLIRSNKEVGLYGPQYIKQKLLQRKFGYEQIVRALTDFYPKEEEEIVARKFLAKQKNLGLSDQKQKQQLLQKFFRRGFSPDAVFRIIGSTQL